MPLPCPSLLFSWQASPKPKLCNAVRSPADVIRGTRMKLRCEVRLPVSMPRMVGGQANIFSTFASGSTLAQISYICRDGSNTPVIGGEEAQSVSDPIHPFYMSRNNLHQSHGRLARILTCQDQCGSISLSGEENCGFGVLVASNASSQACFSKAINVAPQSTDRPILPSSTATTTPGVTPTPVPSSVIIEDADDLKRKMEDAQSKSNSFSEDPNDSTKSDLQNSITDAINSVKKAKRDAETDSNSFKDFLHHVEDAPENLEDAASAVTGAPSSSAAAAAAAAIG
jgi:hypothetical protein